MWEVDKWGLRVEKDEEKVNKIEGDLVAIFRKAAIEFDGSCSDF